MAQTAEGAILALDVGTSSCRASLYDLRGRPLAGRIARGLYAPSVSADGAAELDPNVLFDQVCSAIDELLSEPTPQILGVATDTFWHALLGTDSHGNPLTPIYTWLDSRARGEIAGLRRRLDERAVHARTGCVLHSSYWPARLSWLRRAQPDLFKRVVRWTSFGELILQRLTGECGTSVSMASGTGLLNVHTLEWDPTVLAAIEIDPARLSPIIPMRGTAHTRPAVARRWPALKGVRWLPAIGDGAASNVGAGCTTPESFAVMIGTSGAERVVWTPGGAFEIPWGTWCYRVDDRRPVMGGALNDGGTLLNWLRNSLRLPSIRMAEAELAALPPDGHGLTVLPFWGGERSTGWADHARGAIVGLQLHSRPVEILRACMEAVALRFGEIDRLLRKAMPESGANLVGTGGALLHSDTWMQIMADVLGRPVIVSSEAEASSRGASLLALEALGLLERSIEAIRPAGRRRFEPNPAHTEIYRAAAERQRHLYDGLVT